MDDLKILEHIKNKKTLEKTTAISAVLSLLVLFWGVDTVDNLVFVGFFLYFLLNANRLNMCKKSYNSLFKIDKYVITFDELPTDRLLVGKGFMWHKRQTELTKKLFEDEHIVRNASSNKGIAFLHGIGFSEEKNIYISLDELSGNLLLAGETGAGKTTAYELPIAQAIKRNEAVIIIDPKGDEGLLNKTVYSCRKAGREKDFMFFALPYPSLSVTYNPLQNFTLPNEIADRIATLLPGTGTSETFKSFAWMVLMDVINGLLYLNIRPTLQNIHRYSLSEMETLGKMCVEKVLLDNGLHKVVEDLRKDNAKFQQYYLQYYSLIPTEQRNKQIDDLITRINHPKEHFQKMIASLSPLLTKLTSGEIGALLSTVPAELDWERAIEKKKVVYMFFSSLTIKETAEAVMQMCIQDLISFMGSRYSYSFKKTPVNIFIDEFYEVLGPNFITMINKIRAAGGRLYLATQSLADLETKVPKSSMADQIKDNINIMQWMRTKKNTADYFSLSAGEVTITRRSEGISYSPDLGESDISFRSSYSRSTSEMSIPLVDSTWIQRLPNGHGFVLNAGQVYKVRFPVLEEPNIDYLQEIKVKKS